jgi:2-aminomuconate deaminase
MAYPNGAPFLLDQSTPAGLTRYAHARILPPSTYHTIYISGIAAVTPEGTYEGVTENPDGTYNLDIRVQTAAVLRRIEGIIKGASNGKADLHSIVDAVVYVVDMKRVYAGINEEWNKVWSDRASAPARATIGVKELPDLRFLVEVKAMAVLEGLMGFFFFCVNGWQIWHAGWTVQEIHSSVDRRRIAYKHCRNVVSCASCSSPSTPTPTPPLSEACFSTIPAKNLQICNILRFF